MYKGHVAKPDWVNVKDLFGESNGFQFVIPVYQRDYVWDADDQVKRLLDDYQNLLGNENSHFLGIIIDYLENLGRGYAQQYFVVDGQQRLTTLFLLVYVIYEKALKDNADDAIDILEDCLFVSPKKGKDGGYKLEPLMNGQNVFSKIISGESNLLTEDEKNSKLYLSYEFIQEFVSNDLCDYTADELAEALERLLVVDIPLDADDNPQQIFESINGLGCELSSADLIRNFVLMQCPDGTKKETYNKYWLPFENKFDSQKEFVDFFRYFIESQNAEFVNKKFVYAEFRKWFLIFIKSSSVVDALNLMMKYADYYNDLFYTKLNQFSSNGLWKSINDYRNIKSKMPVPFALDIMRLYRNSIISDNQLKDVLETINAFIVRRAIIGLDTSGITRFFCTLLNNVKQYIGDDYSKLVDAVRFCVITDNKEKGSRFPDDEEVSRVLQMQNTYDYGDALHFFFDKYENEKMQVDSYQSTMSLQIEHIMPQDGSKWYSTVGLTKEDYDVHKMRLGNLTLTTKHDNPKMSNNIFEYKTHILKDTAHFRLNVDVYSEPTWGLNEINKRNQQLIKEFLRLYPLVQCSIPNFFEDKRKIMKQSKDHTMSKNAYASKLWAIVNAEIEENGIFEQRDNGTKSFFDFMVGRPYHCFIDLWNYKNNKVNLGIWFSNAKNQNFRIFHENIALFTNEVFNYYDNYNSEQKNGWIKATVDLIDNDSFENFAENLVKEIYRINDIADTLYIEDLPNKKQEISFISKIDQRQLCIIFDDDNSASVCDITSRLPLSIDVQEKYIIDFLNEKGLDVTKKLSNNINTLIKYQTGEMKTTNWVISCNPNYYDVKKAFEKFDKIEWKQNSNNITVGSFVYIYVGYPCKEIMYKAVVNKVNLSSRSIDDSEFYLNADGFTSNGKYMEIELVQKFDKHKLTYEYLKENGFGSPQGWSKVSKRLYDALLKEE